MKISLILAHPRPGRFNHAIATTAARALRHAGHTVTANDLYAEDHFHSVHAFCLSSQINTLLMETENGY